MLAIPNPLTPTQRENVDRRGKEVLLYTEAFMTHYRWKTSAAPGWTHAAGRWVPCHQVPTRSAHHRGLSQSSPPARVWRYFQRRTHRKTLCLGLPGWPLSQWRRRPRRPGLWRKLFLNQGQMEAAEFLKDEGDKFVYIKKNPSDYSIRLLNLLKPKWGSQALKVNWPTRTEQCGQSKAVCTTFCCRNKIQAWNYTNMMLIILIINRKLWWAKEE